MKTFYLFLSVIAFNNLNAASHANTLNLENSISQYTEDGSPLCIAISKGDFEMVKKLVEYGVNINGKSKDLTPLMVAVMYNRIEIIKYLIAIGAKIGIKDEKGRTALAIAKFNNLEEAAVLLSNELKK
ncbi:ankyrin repeat domain-containing protein [Flavobacterium sp. XS2P39]|uniref:ankyrin repeat domain-containing protein n=1 Tax=Flavobacterium sp. XS2P39 TaxID=3401725 RepID=UPI003AAF80B2